MELNPAATVLTSGSYTNGDILREAMGLAQNSGHDPLAAMLQSLLDHHPCFVKAATNEPLFILRGKDRVAPRVVKKWIKYARRVGASDRKLEDAKCIQKCMKKFPGRLNPC